MIFTKEEKLEQLEIFYSLAKEKINTDANTDTILFPYARGDEKVEIIWTKANGDVRSVIVHNPL